MQHDRDVEPRAVAPEPGPQPDPMLKDGRAGTGRTWAVTAVIVAVLLAVMYGIAAHRGDGKGEQRQSQVQTSTQSSTTPGQALPGGRTTADAPPTAKPSTVTPGPSK